MRACVRACAILNISHRAPHQAFKEEIRSLSLSLFQLSPPLLFRFHWLFFFALFRPARRVLPPLVISHLLHSKRSLRAPWIDCLLLLVPAGFFFFFLCCCTGLSVCICIFLSPAGETTVPPRCRESWPRRRKATRRRKRLNSKTRYRWAYLSLLFPSHINININMCVPALNGQHWPLVTVSGEKEWFGRLRLS